ncbi:MAG TPA: polysaccharide deacetylase family protein [Pyrinomonadaceae bacterium]|nr:polysaccharide deacetylase family protein [Pyrinomonadaceae bacterium]
MKKILAFIFLFAIVVGGQTKQREVAVTFDDLPATHGDYKSITDRLLAKLKAEQIPTIGFVNESKLWVDNKIDSKRVNLLKQWLDEGHELGNHTFSHIYIDQATFEEYIADLIRGETITKMLLAEKGQQLKYYRHTQLRTGPTEEYRLKLNEFLAKRNYTVAPVTIDNNDYIFASAYLQAKRKGDKALQERLATAYIEYMEKVFEHFEKLSQEFLGYEVKQTLLLHANEINADHFDKLAQMMKRRGYKFITLEEALKDESYRLPEAQSKRGLSWLHRWMLAKGLPMKEEPSEPSWVAELAR